MDNTLHNNIPNTDIEAPRRRLICPLCGKHTVLWLFPDTEIKNLPIKCKRCGKEIIVNVKPLNNPQNYISAKASSVT